MFIHSWFSFWNCNKCVIFRNSDLFASFQTLEPGAYPGFSSLSPPEQTTPIQPRNPEMEQRAKAMRGRMCVSLTAPPNFSFYCRDNHVPALITGFQLSIRNWTLVFLLTQVCFERADSDRERLRQRPRHRGGGEKPLYSSLRQLKPYL